MFCVFSEVLGINMYGIKHQQIKLPYNYHQLYMLPFTNVVRKYNTLIKQFLIQFMFSLSYKGIYIVWKELFFISFTSQKNWRTVEWWIGNFRSFQKRYCLFKNLWREDSLAAFSTPLFWSISFAHKTEPESWTSNVKHS